MKPQTKNKIKKTFEYLKKNSWKILAIILLLYFGFSFIVGTNQGSYQLGFQDGQSSVVIGIAQTGEIPLLTEQGQLNLVSIQEICQGVQG